MAYQATGLLFYCLLFVSAVFLRFLNRVVRVAVIRIASVVALTGDTAAGLAVVH